MYVCHLTLLCTWHLYIFFFFWHPYIFYHNIFISFFFKFFWFLRRNLYIKVLNSIIIIHTQTRLVLQPNFQLIIYSRSWSVFFKGLDSTYFRLCATCSLCSAIQLCFCRAKADRSRNEWVCLCFSKTLFTK